MPLGPPPPSLEASFGTSEPRYFTLNLPFPIRLTAFPYRKIPWRLSVPQKRRQRKRLRLVDNVVATVDNALKKHNMGSTTKLERWKEEMPTEAEMRPKDKYTMFDRKERRYRKGIHST